MVGALAIVVVLLLLPVIVLLWCAAGAALLGSLLNRDAADRHQGSELVELNR